MRYPVIILLSALCLFFGCKEGVSPSSPKAFPVVKVNGKTYTTQDLWDYAGTILWEIEPKDYDNPELSKEILSSFVEHKLLLAEAERRKLRPDKERLDQMDLLLESVDGAKELKAITGRYNIDSKKTAALITEQLMVSELFRAITVTTDVTEAELKKYYEFKSAQNQSSMGLAHILHIFTTSEEESDKAAAELAQGILFQEVARKYSEGPEQSAGGDLGIVSEAAYPEFFSAAFKLKEGETSQVIKSDYGYHIFRLVQYARRNSYEGAKSKLLAELYIQKRQKAIGEFINALYANADIEYLRHVNLAEVRAAAKR